MGQGSTSRYTHHHDFSIDTYAKGYKYIFQIGLEVTSMAKYKLTRTDRSKWLTNLKRFTAPVLTMYVLQLSSMVSSGVVPQLHDLVPNALTQGSVWGYVLSSALDLFGKWSKA